MRIAKARFLREQAGFTLPEMMITITVMIVVLFALYNIFDASVRIFSFGNDKVEAVENARIGLEKIERELRAAYPPCKGCSPSQTQLLSTMTVDRIVFRNDLNSNNRGDDPGETIGYQLGGTGSSRVLGRSVDSGALQEVVEFVLPPGAASPYTGAPSPYPGGLRFKYLKEDGVDADTEMDTTTVEAEVKVVRVELDISKDGRVQTLTTDVALRNRGE